MRRILLSIFGLAAVLALLIQQGQVFIAADHPPSSPAGVDTSQDLFADVSQQAGIVHNRLPGIEHSIGQAWGDYDNDDWPDLYLTDPLGPNTLYQNQGDGTFRVSPFSQQVALAQAYSNGASFVDYDNDGWSDLYVANWGPDRLFRNQQGAGFEDVTAAAFGPELGDPFNSQTASWGDYDNDGYLDLYVANWACYPECGRPGAGDTDSLYHNNGDGTFTQVNKLLKVRLNGAGFVAGFTDYDNDGDLDIYLVNDEFINPIGNVLWRNDGPGCEGWCFTEVAQAAGANTRVMGMGLAVGDYDNDLDLDFYFSNSGPMTLLQNQGNGAFINTAPQAGVDFGQGIAWGSVFLDYNNDGWQDLYLAVMSTTNGKDIAANPLFFNNGDGTFTKVACQSGVADVHPSMGVATADYDRDGWVDLVVGNVDESYRLYRNQAANVLAPQKRGNWLALELVGGGPVNRDAVGARVYLSAGGLTQLREVTNGGSLGAGSELALYFGLGQAVSADLQVRWPDGSQQTLSGLSANQHYRLTYGAEAAERLPGSKAASLAAANAGPDSRLLGFLLALLLLLVAGGASLKLANDEQTTLGPRPSLAWGLVGAGAGLVILALLLAPPWTMPRTSSETDLNTQLAQRMAQAGVKSLQSPSFSPALVKLGEALFWDPELSGNRDTACATCHHSNFATGDGLPVSVGTGGRGLGPERELPINTRFIPRNAPPVFNLGYAEWTVMFWDGRVSGDPESGFNTPAGDRLPAGLDNLLAAQAMFPVTSREEMRGSMGDRDIFNQPNELAVVLDYEVSMVWRMLMKRLLAIPGYVELFQAAYPDIPAAELGFQHAANALAAYQAVVFTFEDSPFDRYLHGDLQALSEAQVRGALLFYGEAGCAACHAGGLLTDQQFHNLAVPQLGHGKGREKPLDLGRARESGNDCERFAFRTPPLRNVALTGPWMHNGAFTTLEATVRHHLDPVNDLLNYDETQLPVALQETCKETPEVLAAILASFANEPAARNLNEDQIRDLLAFLDALTSPGALDLSHTIPAEVPSGLTVGGD